MASINKESKNAGGKKEELKKTIEKQIETAVWLQTFALIAETVLTSKLLSLDEEDVNGEHDILMGTLVQTVGQFLQSIGVSQQVSFPDQELFVEGQKIVVTGDFIQLIGVAMKAFGGKRELLEAMQDVSKSDFIP
ncbi:MULTISPECIES: hypothetical protein [Clostridia]|uniref:hypothetical protein n=1 Tax=Clostridia TaxID=186801 RepID=UPI000EA2B193|nr:MULTISPECIES: hypothetical protein [Clostridia]NBJ68119.1 hypothetical protein [Roseburia sp. 1XD42-34]RKI81894.1 hypothetical protein D7V87_01325 [Clostridium sp. 1xD42-85]